MEERKDQPQSSWDKKLKGCVLVAEDDVADRAFFSEILRSLRLYCLIINNNSQAVQAMTSTSSGLTYIPCDALLLKHSMTQISGLEAAESIYTWRKQQELPALPVIILTEDGHTRTDMEERAVGISAFLQKPFTQEDLYNILKDQSSVFSGSDDSNIVARTGIDIALLDQDALNEIRALQKDGSTDILQKIITLYFTNSPELAQSIEEALLAEEADKLKTAAHTLKSSSAILGATDLSALCGRLEMIGRTGVIDNDMERMLNQFRYEYMAVKRALAAEYHR